MIISIQKSWLFEGEHVNHVIAKMRLTCAKTGSDRINKMYGEKTLPKMFNKLSIALRRCVYVGRLESKQPFMFHGPHSVVICKKWFPMGTTSVCSTVRVY